MSTKSKWISGVSLLAFILSLTALTGCWRTPENDNPPSQDTTATSFDGNAKVEEVYNPDVMGKDFGEYILLLGLTKEELVGTLNEEPVSIDEGGREFQKAGIRVWFDPESYTKVDQIFTARGDIDFNGAKIGDPVAKFEEAFGTPVTDRNGDAHFKYDDVF